MNNLLKPNDQKYTYIKIDAQILLVRQSMKYNHWDHAGRVPHVPHVHVGKALSNFRQYRIFFTCVYAASSYTCSGSRSYQWPVLSITLFGIWLWFILSKWISSYPCWYRTCYLQTTSFHICQLSYDKLDQQSQNTRFRTGLTLSLLVADWSTSNSWTSHLDQ